VATSRPETIFGDVALAVNPEDLRYSKFIGTKAKNPLNGRLLPIISDQRVKSNFGTGMYFHSLLGKMGQIPIDL